MPERDGDPKPRSRRMLIISVVTVIVAIMLGVGGIMIRTHMESALASQTDAAAVVSVDVITPRHNDSTQSLVLPGDIQAWYSAPIYGQVSGYLHMWYKDIGAVVKAGDVLADISTPTLDQQLVQSRAALAQAQAAAQLADVTAARWQALLKTHAVSQQHTDVTTSDAVVKHANVAAAEADVGRLEALEGFKRLVAPFDGVVTARRTDVGALIRADNVPGPELFTVADIHAMRVYVRVPQAYAAQIKVGMKAQLHLPEYPDRSFPATLITTAHGVNMQSRTVLVELEAPNPEGILSPGSYASVEFELPPNEKMLLLPTTALMFQEHGMQVATVGKDNKVALQAVKIGRDLGTEVEIVAGLQPSAQVIDQPPDDLDVGEEVKVEGHHLAPPASDQTKHVPVPGS